MCHRESIGPGSVQASYWLSALRQFPVPQALIGGMGGATPLLYTCCTYNQQDGEREFIEKGRISRGKCYG